MIDDKIDWSEYPLYSHTLKSWNFKYPPDQKGLDAMSLSGVGIVSKAFSKSWNIKKAADVLGLANFKGNYIGLKWV